MSEYAPQFGLSAGYQPEAAPEEMIARLREFGFTALELNMRYIERHRDALDILPKALEALTCHLPHDKECSALSADEGDDARVLEALARHAGLAAEVGCRTFVFHLKNVMRQTVDQYWERSIRFARQLGDIVQQHGAVVGLENCYPVVRWGETAKRFLDEVDHPHVGLTLDTGHFWSARCENEIGCHEEDPLKCTDQGNRELNEACLEMAEAVNRRIFNIHIHNLREEDWLDHQPVDKGVMRYEKLFDALRGMGYNRTIMIELRGDGSWAGFESSAAFLRSLQ